MLTVTSNAADAIRNLTSQPGVPHTGVRIAGTGGEEPSLTLGLSEAPEPGDEVIEEQGARVFLEPEAAATLDDKALDAQVDAEGSVSFLVGEVPS